MIRGVGEAGLVLDQAASEVLAGTSFTRDDGSGGLAADLGRGTELMGCLRRMSHAHARKAAMGLLRCCVRATVPGSDCSERGRQARQVLELVEEGTAELDSVCVGIFLKSAAEAIKEGIASLEESDCIVECARSLSVELDHVCYGALMEISASW